MSTILKKIKGESMSTERKLTSPINCIAESSVEFGDPRLTDVKIARMNPKASLTQLKHLDLTVCPITDAAKQAFHTNHPNCIK